MPMNSRTNRVSTGSNLFYFFLVAFAALHVPGQPPEKSVVTVNITKDGSSSELPFIAIGGPVGVKLAKFSAMYFGPKKDVDISFLLLAKFPRPRYSGKRTFGIKFLINDNVHLSNNLRMVNRVVADEDGESLQFSVTEEEIAWLALGESLDIMVYDADGAQKLDKYRFTAGGLKELKKFAMSVLLLRNYDL